MNEADYKTALIKLVNQLPGGYGRRLEDKYAVGLLDLVMKIPGLPWMWGEGKLVDGQKFAPTLRQYEEGKRIQATGTPVLLIGFQAKLMAISSWAEEARFKDCFQGSVHPETIKEFYDRTIIRWGAST